MKTGKIDRRFKPESFEYFGPVAKCEGWLQALENQSISGPIALGAVQTMAAVGANVIAPVPSLVVLSAAGVATCTLALPVAGVDDGKVMCIVSTTANAHTVTTPATGLNKTLHIATFAAAVGAYLWLVAIAGTWYVLNSNSAAFVNNVTLT
jgi:hypothetical protein